MAATGMIKRRKGRMTLNCSILIIGVIARSSGWINTKCILGGICNAHLQLLSQQPDSLIVRKSGLVEGQAIQQLVSETNRNDLDARQELDQHLRRDGNRFNPGTTADLIAAALFVLIIASQKSS